MYTSGYLSVPGLRGIDGNSTRSSLSEASGVSGASTRTYVNEASTLVLETIENGVKKYVCSELNIELLLFVVAKYLVLSEMILNLSF